jgi:hypothetical protein
MFNWIKTTFAWDTVGTLVKARIEMIGAGLAAALAALASYSFLPYLTADKVDLKTVLIVAGYVGASAFITEIVRRWNATDI